MNIYTLQESNVQRSEDALYHGINTFAVFDGASSLISFKNKNGNTGGFLASQIAKNVFENNPYLSLEEMFRIINDTIRKSMQKEDIDISKKENLWCTTAAAVRIEGKRIKYAQITDSIILAIYDDGSYEELGKNSDHDKDTLIEWKGLGNISQIEKRNILNDKIIRQRQNQNITYGFLSGEKNYESFVNFGEIDGEGVRHLLLFTDGLIPVKVDPKLPDDYSELIRQYFAGGLSQVLSWHRGLEKLDPECTIYPRFKIHDDVAAIAIDL